MGPVGMLVRKTVSSICVFTATPLQLIIPEIIIAELLVAGTLLGDFILMIIL
jgi:hypothetical protein